MGPLSLMYGWPAILLALAAAGLTQLLKAVIDTAYEAQWKRMDDDAKAAHKASSGRGRRKQSIVVTRFVLPMAPILIGMAYANVVPLIPEELLSYITENAIDGWQAMAAKAAWGGACGMFSNYLYDRMKKTMQHVAKTQAT